MALIGKNNEEKIWNYLKSKGLNDYGVAGLMGNLFAESALNPRNLQNTYEKKLGFTDDSYTTAVDNGTYSNFIKDSAGYGLAQWTFWSRKQLLLNYAKSVSKSIGDLEMQLDFLYKELSENYKSVLSTLKTATSVFSASNSVLLNFERPADQSSSVQNKRAEYGKKYYDKYKNDNHKEEVIMGYTNSSLVNCVVKSPNHSGRRTHSIDRITPHCVVGQLSAEGIGSCFPSGRSASCNYGIGKDGRVCLIVDEANRSWCSSSNANDQRAVTIECASDMSEPYAMNSAVYEKLIKLCADICRRNGKNKLIWFADKNKSLNYSPKSNEMVLTVHRWFANKSCPGNWLYSRLGDVASRVTAQLGGSSTSTPITPTPPTSMNTNFPKLPFLVEVLVSDLNYRSSASMSGKILGQTGKGKFTITEVKNGWGKLKSGAGWIYLENASYCKIGTTVSNNGNLNNQSSDSYKVKVTADVLNIRKGAGTNYGISGSIRDKGIYTIIAESTGKGATKWGKLKSGAGWISLDYCKKV